MGLSLSYDDKIAVLDLGDDENRFSPEFLDRVDAHLDEVLASDAQGLVTTGGAKFYSNGLDLDWLTAHGHEVFHIDATGPVKLHQLLPEARVIDGELIYRGDRLL